ncbi:SapC family protein [Pseudomarimonas salicorniae]|uniref:SapC family protein n=1 Tax=Pseudomarimonas salicorniae TaxID=2933270 RepID=A0ABT0GID3_9GAMM|nr:SapC family protein [Lysobacter sp. CAU 1642]MCK7594305.1 SapC family protein [Lysobacter sp. CAU 1642]
MAQHLPLNPTAHRDLRVITTRGAAYGDAMMSALTFPAEFRSVQAHYPIVFQKLPDQGFQPIALFGLKDGENLFLQGTHWDAHYVPMAVERQPFLIGRGESGPAMHIDLDSPRVSRSAGEPLFNEHGGTTPFLERMNELLGQLHEGMSSVVPFVAALDRHGLLESFVLDVAQPDGGQARLAGFYTINEEKLAALDAEALHGLHQAGHLAAIYMAIASLSQFRALVERAQRTIRHDW